MVQKGVAALGRLVKGLTCEKVSMHALCHMKPFSLSTLPICVQVCQVQPVRNYRSSCAVMASIPPAAPPTPSLSGPSESRGTVHCIAHSTDTDVCCHKPLFLPEAAFSSSRRKRIFFGTSC